MRTLFLNPPSYEGFDGGAGARYQAKREIRSYWYPTWLAQPAALVPDSLLVDAPPAGMSLADIVPLAAGHDLAVLYTSSPTFAGDVKVAEALKEANPGCSSASRAAKVAVRPEESLQASTAIDFVAREEFDFTIAEVAEGRPLAAIDGLSYRDERGAWCTTPTGPSWRTWTGCRPFAGLQAGPAHRGLLHRLPAATRTSRFTPGAAAGRGARSACGRRPWAGTGTGPAASAQRAAEAALAKELFPQMKELFFDDDTFTDDRPRAEEIARGLGQLGLTWSCNAKANVPRETLKIMRDNGLRLLLVGYESGNQQILINIKKGLRVERAKQFAADCRDLGITVHGTFILGLPGETKETIQETIKFAREVNPHTIQVSVAAPYPGTELYRQARGERLAARRRRGSDPGQRVGHAARGAELPAPGPHRDPRLGGRRSTSGSTSAPPKIAEMSAEMLRHPSMAARRLREGTEFIQFLGRRDRTQPRPRAPPKQEAGKQPLVSQDVAAMLGADAPTRCVVRCPSWSSSRASTPGIRAASHCPCPNGTNWSSRPCMEQYRAR